jgi:LEA14-like dessication related protein
LLKKPEIKFKEVKIIGFDLKNINLDFSIEVINPYNFDFLLKSMKYVFYIGDRALIDSKIQLNKQLSANQTSMQTLQIQLSYMSIGHFFSEILAKRNIETKIVGEVSVSFQEEFGLPNELNLPFSFRKIVDINLK